MSPMVVNISEEQLLARRARVLEQIRSTEEELRRKAVAGALTGAEWEGLEVLDRIAFLLDDSG